MFCARKQPAQSSARECSQNYAQSSHRSFVKPFTRSFARDESGHFALITALALSVLLTGVGMAIDYGGATSEQRKLQQALDHAILSASSEADADEARIREVVAASMARNFAPQRAEDANSLNVELDIGAKTIRAKADTQYSTFLMGLFGVDTMKIAAEVGAPRIALPALDLALVVDTTSSMAGSNMADLQAAALDLIDRLDTPKSKVRVSLVPYGQYVNVGMSASTEAWVDIGDIFEITPGETRTYSVPIGGTPATCQPTGLEIPVFLRIDGRDVQTGTTPEMDCQGGTPHNDTITSTSTDPEVHREYEWNGCMGSRPDPLNLRPEADAADPIPAALNELRWRYAGDPWIEHEPYVAPDLTDPDVLANPDLLKHPETRQTMCGQVITPLTNKMKLIRDRISSLTTSGETYLASGLMWGWRTLDPNTPYTQAASAKPGTPRAMIFLTDGENTSAQSGRYHTIANRNTWHAKAGLDHAAALCEQIKADGIDIFTVAYNFSDGPLSAETGTMLQQCATSTDKSFTPDNREDLMKNFEQITNSLATVRIAY